MAGRRKLSLLAVVACGACSDLFGPGLPEHARPLIPPDAYATWWAQVESCSVIEAPMSRIHWYVVPALGNLADGSFCNPATRSAVRGLWVAPHDIYLGDSYWRWSPVY